MANYGDGRPGGMSGPVWMLIGIVIGCLGTFGGIKALHHGAKAPSKDEDKPLPAVHVPTSSGVIAFTADVGRKGIVLASSVPLKLVQNGDSKLAHQDERNVFAGFRSWPGTANYLNSGQGEFIVKTASGDPVETGWTPAQYIAFVKGEQLQMRAQPGQQYTVFFQRKGRNPINLATVALSSGGSSAPGGSSSGAADKSGGGGDSKSGAPADDKGDSALSTP